MPGRVLLVLSLWSLACAAQAQIHQCRDASGARHYQDQPCAADQRAVPFDLDAGNFSTFDSAVARREAQGAIATLEQIRERRRLEAQAKAVRAPIPPGEPAPGTQPADARAFRDDGVVLLPYPVYREPQHPPHPPPAPREGPVGGYAPDPPRLRDLAPRPRATGREALDEAPTSRR